MLDNQAFIASVREWIAPNFISEALAVTLTMKQVYQGQKLDETRASTSMRYFLKRLNQEVHGNAARRYPSKRICVFPVLDVSPSQRIHYHLALVRPEKIPRLEFELMIRRNWVIVPFGFQEIEIRDMYSSSWIDYMIRRNPTDYRIDFENIHLPAC